MCAWSGKVVVVVWASADCACVCMCMCVIECASAYDRHCCYGWLCALSRVMVVRADVCCNLFVAVRACVFACLCVIGVLLVIVCVAVRDVVCVMYV